MSIQLQCDWCGDIIEDDRNGVAVDIEENGSRRPPRMRHYHGSPCWTELEEIVEFGREARENLSLLPVCEEPPDPFAGSIDIRELDLHPVALHALREAGIETLADLATRTRGEIAGIRGIGTRRMWVIEGAMEDRGLDFCCQVAR